MIPCTFKIIQVAVAAYMVFVQENENKDRFNTRDIEAHRNLLIMWCFSVGQQSMPKTCYSLLLDNDNLKKHKVIAHHKCIQPTLKASAAVLVDPAKTVDVLRQLEATIVRSSKAAEAQNTI
jgi:hypothetical protein